MEEKDSTIIFYISVIVAQLKLATNMDYGFYTPDGDFEFQEDTQPPVEETSFTLSLIDRANVQVVGPQICTCSQGPVPCMHFLAKTGQVKKLKEIFAKVTNDSEILKIDSRNRTILHYAANFRGDPDKSRACVDLIIDEIRLRNVPRMFDFVNAKEELGMTALYLGVKTENLDVCSSLIRAESDWDIMCDRRKSPIQKMFKKIPHIITTYFLQNAAESLEYSNDEASEVLIDFGTFIGYPSEEDIKMKKLNVYEETDFLSNLCYTPLHKRGEILAHPLVKTFIYIKWQKIKFFFWMSRLFQTVWALIYFWFLMEVYRKLCPYPSAEQYEFSWSRFVPSVVSLENFTNISNLNLTETEFGSCHSSSWIQICAYILLIIATFDLLYFEVHPTYIRFRRYWYPMKKVTLRKLYKRCLLFFRLMHFEKIFLLLTIYINLTPLLLYSSLDLLGEWQYITASIGVFLTWLHIFLQIGKVPTLAVYIKMLEKVLATLGVITLIYISLIFAFAMVFCVLLPGVPSYSSPLQALLKMTTFLIGEVEYEKYFYDKNSENISVSLSATMFFYGVAILVLHIALLNFLIGLTVADVQTLEQYTDVWRSFYHVWQISLFESLLSRCPFKVGLPWLKKISVTASGSKRKCSIKNRNDNSSVGNFDVSNMKVNVRLMDLPKPLSKEIRLMIHNREKSQNQETII